MKNLRHRFGAGFAERFAAVKIRFVRARYFRGHGVHSPFVYGLVREVFMRSELLPGDRALFRALSEIGMPERRAVQLQNLAIHAGYGTFGLNRAEGAFCIATREVSGADLLALVQRAAEMGAAVAVLDPYGSRERQMLCRRIVSMHCSTSVDNRAYLLLFNNHLPKQHFVL